MRKKGLGVTLDENLVNQIDEMRRRKGVEQGRDISRSSFVNELLIVALDKVEKTS